MAARKGARPSTPAIEKAGVLNEAIPDPAPGPDPSPLADAVVPTKLPVDSPAPDPSPSAGFIGWSPSSDTDNADHSLLTGPSSPALQPNDRTQTVQPSLPS